MTDDMLHAVKLRAKNKQNVPNFVTDFVERYNRHYENQVVLNVPDFVTDFIERYNRHYR